MKNKYFQLLLITTLVLSTFSLLSAQELSRVAEQREDHLRESRALSGLRSDIAEEYTVRPGDIFFIRIYSPIITTDREQDLEPIVPVTITGHLIIYPLTAPIKVAGLSLTAASELIKSEISRHIPEAEIFVDLYDIQPYTVHITGAVEQPGEYVVDSLVTLYQSLHMASGLSPAASKKISVTRQGKTRVFDLNTYLVEGDLSQNPILFGDDFVRAVFADDFAKIYVVTDTLNYVEYFEMEREKRVDEIIPLLRQKYPYTDYRNIFLRREGKTEKIAQSHLLRAGDNVYLHPEESFIYVGGSVNSPGRFNYLAHKSPQYYIALAGGIDRYGSSKRVFVVSDEGDRIRFRGQELREGDSIIVPLSTRTIITDYLTPISAIVSVVATIIVLTQ